MKKCTFLSCFICLLFYSIHGYAQTKQVELPGTEVWQFQSKIDTQQYVLYIHLPDDYKKTKKYPVLYVTDGQWFFASMYVGYGGQHYDGLIPDLITVGITWTDNYGTRRGRDFTPTSIPNFQQAGNAPAFLSVIKNEVIRMIDSAYSTDPSDRALYGTSLGGLFAVYTLFHEPALFNRYLIVSPSLWWDKELVFKYEKSFAEKNKVLRAKIFLCSGEYEEAVDASNTFNRFANQLRGSKYTGLELETLVVPRMGHSGSGTVGGIMGLQSIYGKANVPLDIARLNQLTGAYNLGNDTLRIIKENNALFAVFGFAKTKLYAENPQTLYTKGMSGTMQFKSNDKGIVSGYNLVLSDTTLFFKKLIK